jgi:tetratricopeptide (TPR) repeat protein
LYETLCSSAAQVTGAGDRQKGHSVIQVLRIVLLIGLLTVADSSFSQVKAAPDSRRQQALSFESQGKNAEAEQVWRAYLKDHASSAEAYAHLGLLESRQQHYKEAAPLYRKAMQLGPEVPGLRLNLGLALFKGGELKQAIQEFGILLKAQPDNQQLNTLIGLAHYGLAEYKDAVPFLRVAAAHDTKNLILRLALAHSCLWTKQNQCVLDVYREILELDPNSAEADMVAGEALDEMKDNEGSTKMFRAAVKANPKEPNVHFGLGYLLWTQKQYKEAATELQAELANDPNHLQAMLYLSDTYIQMNQLADAKPLLEKVVKANPSLGLAHLDLGIVYLESEKNQDALRELALAEKLTPNDVNVHWRLGRLYRTLGRKDEAKAEFDQANVLNKQADDDLYKKIANGRTHHDPTQTAPPTPPDATPPAPSDAK